jgi:DNA-binding CsgD family transcriptional regulator
VPSGQIASQLNLSIKTIETHQAHIKQKLGLSSAHELNQRAIRWIMDQES